MKTVYEDGKWMEQAQDRAQWQALVLNFQFLLTND
jgi:hypothetical protein